jgi:hypothetical protein
MKKEIAKKWVRALRSGKYKQAKSVLKTKTKKGLVRHCCLGVLCELYQNDCKRKKKKGLRVLEIEPYGYEAPETSTVFEFNDDPTVLPETVRSWAGLKSDDGRFRNEDTEFASKGEICRNLVALNDNGAKFEKIADIIEANVTNL